MKSQISLLFIILVIYSGCKHSTTEPPSIPQDPYTGITVTGPDIIKYDGTNSCRILAEQKIMAIIYRDAFTNQFRIERYEYLDE